MLSLAALINDLTDGDRRPDLFLRITSTTLVTQEGDDVDSAVEGLNVRGAVGDTGRTNPGFVDTGALLTFASGVSPRWLVSDLLGLEGAKLVKVDSIRPSRRGGAPRLSLKFSFNDEDEDGNPIDEIELPLPVKEFVEAQLKNSIGSAYVYYNSADVARDGASCVTVNWNERKKNPKRKSGEPYAYMRIFSTVAVEHLVDAGGVIPTDYPAFGLEYRVLLANTGTGKVIPTKRHMRAVRANIGSGNDPLFQVAGEAVGLAVMRGEDLEALKSAYRTGLEAGASAWRIADADSVVKAIFTKKEAKDDYWGKKAKAADKYRAAIAEAVEAITDSDLGEERELRTLFAETLAEALSSGKVVLARNANDKAWQVTKMVWHDIFKAAMAVSANDEPASEAAVS